MEMQLPVLIGDYTDFYSSKEHATNVGKMFRDPENALLPNWLHIPWISWEKLYHTFRNSSTQPIGQTLPAGETTPVFGPSRLIDFELETAFITTDANVMGNDSINEAEDYIFGMVLLNDWSARDIQKWEYVPLGPFLAKKFCIINITLDCYYGCIGAFRVPSPKQDPSPLLICNKRKIHSISI
jgi:fumarylacetoacetase